jgi:transglutaminase-like putative cysteine protease
VSAASTVEADAPPLPAPPSWDEIHARGGEGPMYEFLQPTLLTTVAPDLVATAREVVAGADPHEAVEGLTAWLRDNVEYMPGATGVTSAQEAWEKRQGVCQDLAHLVVGCYGPVRVRLPPPGSRRMDPDTVAGQSHA